MIGYHYGPMGYAIYLKLNNWQLLLSLLIELSIVGMITAIVIHAFYSEKSWYFPLVVFILIIIGLIISICPIYVIRI